MLFTIFTPTFNRAHTLHRVYNSIKKQTLKDYEWLIIDDGSTDNTKNLISKWNKKNHFPIIYKYKKNQGKHLAINDGVKIANGRFFLIADSDDSFPKDSLKTMYDFWLSIPKKSRYNFAGISGLCEYENGNIVGNKFPFSPMDSTPQEIYFKYKVKGEKWGFFVKDILKKYPFPRNKETNFMFESFIWQQIGKKYKFRYINQILRTYFPNEKFSLTNKNYKNKIKNSKYYALSLDENIKYFKYSPIEILKISLLGIRFSLHNGDKISNQIIRLKNNKSRIIWIVILIPGFIFFLIDKFVDVFEKN